MKKPLQVYDPNNRTWREVQPAKANRQKGYMYINNDGTGMWAQQEPTRVVSNHLIPCDPPLEYTFGANVLAMARKRVTKRFLSADKLLTRLYNAMVGLESAQDILAEVKAFKERKGSV